MAAPTISQQIPNTFLATTDLMLNNMPMPVDYNTDHRDLNRHFTGATSFFIRSAGALDVSGVTQTVFTVPGQGTGNSIALTLPISADWEGRSLIGSAAAATKLALVHSASATEISHAGNTVTLNFQATSTTLQDLKTLWEDDFGGAARIVGDSAQTVAAFSSTGSVRTTNGAGDGSLVGGVLGITGTLEPRVGSDFITVTVRATNADGSTDMSFDVRVAPAVLTGAVNENMRPDSSSGNIGDWWFDGNEAWWKKDSGVWDDALTLGEDSGVRVRFLEAGTNRTTNYALFDSGEIPAALVKTVLQNGNTVVPPVTMRVGFGFTQYGGGDADWGAAEHPGGVQIRIKDSNGSYRASQVDFTDDWETNFQYIVRKTVQNNDELYIGRVTGADVVGAVVDDETVYAYAFPSTNIDWFTGTGGANHATERLQTAFVDSRVRGTGVGVSSGWIPTSIGEGNALKWAAYSKTALSTPSAPTATPQVGGFLVNSPALSPGAGSWGVRHRLVGDSVWTESNNLIGASAMLTGLSSGQQYQIQVRQLPPTVGSSYLNSAWSPATTATVPTTALSAPNAPNVASGDRSLTVTRPGAPPTGAASWQIIYTTNANPPVSANVTVPAGTSDYNVPNLDPAVEYTVTVKWVAAGDSGYSDSPAGASTTAYPYSVVIGGSVPSSLTEETLNGAEIRLELHANTPVFESSLSASEFELASAGASGATVASASRSTLNSRHAVLTISHDPTANDFDSDLAMSVTVRAAAYGGKLQFVVVQYRRGGCHDGNRARFLRSESSRIGHVGVWEHGNNGFRQCRRTSSADI